MLINLQGDFNLIARIKQKSNFDKRTVLYFGISLLQVDENMGNSFLISEKWTKRDVKQILIVQSLESFVHRGSTPRIWPQLLQAPFNFRVKFVAKVGKQKLNKIIKLELKK